MVHEQAQDMRDMTNPEAGKGFIMHNARSFIQEMLGGLTTWAQKRSLWPLTFGIKCCAIEMMAFGASRYDCHRMGVLFRATPRQSDLMIVAGPATIKLKDTITRLYDQMPEPKYVIAFGECAICGGPFWDSYSVINGVDKLIPVDVYVPGCPPRPEQLLLAVLKLQEKIDAKHKSRKTEVIGMPSATREELLAQVMAHPTLKMGHQSDVPRVQPTPEELAASTPTGQPADYELVSPQQSKHAMETPQEAPAATKTPPKPAAVAKAPPQPAPKPTPVEKPGAVAKPTPKPAVQAPQTTAKPVAKTPPAAPKSVTKPPTPIEKPAPKASPKPAPVQKTAPKPIVAKEILPDIEYPEHVKKHISPDQGIKPVLPKWPKK